MGWDEGSLTEQQMKQTITTVTLMRRICKAKQKNAESNSLCPIPGTILCRD